MAGPLSPVPAARAPAVDLRALLADSGVRPIVVEHARRGLTLQLTLRAVLVVFVIATYWLLPPAVGVVASGVITAAYAVSASALGVWLWRGGRSALLYGWLGLYVDLAALTALSLIADESAVESWTANALQLGFFLLPVLAATQMRWVICAGVVVPTVVLYAIEAVVTRDANLEPWSSIWLRTFVLAGVGVAAIGLSRIQRSRVAAIAGLAQDRSSLLGELMTVTDREHRTLAEDLHDGALQYILAARFDLEDARDSGDEEAFGRLDRALTQSARQLRSQVSALHPAVLEKAGLAAALDELATAAGERGQFAVDLDTAAWPGGTHPAVDPLLFGAARELLANVVKHAKASSVSVSLAERDGVAELAVVDDGVGADAATVATRVAEGHIGLDSQRVKIEAAGGRLTIDSRPGGGTAARISVPAARTAPAESRSA